MHSAAFAEWIVARFTNRKHAASIVGDLLELKPQKGNWWFWLAVAGVVFALSWRQSLAFVACFYAGGWVFSGFQMAAYGMHAQHRPPMPWEPVVNVLSGTATVLWIVGVYSAIRYSLRDRATQLALAFASILSAFIFYWWQPLILVACIAVAFCLAGALMRNQGSREAVFILFVTSITGFAAFFSMLYVNMRYQHFIYPGLVGDRELSKHPSIALIDCCLILMIYFIIVSTYSRMHRRMISRLPTDLEIES